MAWPILFADLGDLIYAVIMIIVIISAVAKQLMGWRGQAPEDGPPPEPAAPQPARPMIR